MPDRRPTSSAYVTDQHPRWTTWGAMCNPQVRNPNIDRLASEGRAVLRILRGEPGLHAQSGVDVHRALSKATGSARTETRCTVGGGNAGGASGERISGPRLSGRSTSRRSRWKRRTLSHTSSTRQAATGQRAERFRCQYYGLEDVCLVDGHGSYASATTRDGSIPSTPAPGNCCGRHRGEVANRSQGLLDRHDPRELHYNTYIADKTIEFLRNRDADRPFFMWCSFPDPHHHSAAPPIRRYV